MSLLLGCAPSVSPDTYSVGSVGQANFAVHGRIVNARPVTIEGTSVGGATSGAALGAIGGSAIGGDARSNIAGAVAGAIVGGVVGAAIQESATTQNGEEYIVKTDNGALITVVQGPMPALEEGTAVFVLYGDRSRVIPADTAKRDHGAAP